jgi:FMN-dependent NADH-azoreductase
MTHLLHLDSSARDGDSYSRLLGRELVRAWSDRDPAAVLTYRDLDADPLEFVSDSWVTAAFTPAQDHDEEHRTALSRSEQLLSELAAADVLIIGAPMYNFGIPAALKAWIDQVVRVGRTFGYDGPTPVGLVHGKRAIILATSGGDARFYEQAGLDHRSSYLRAILGFIGISDIEIVTVVNTVTGDVDLTEARAQLDALIDGHRSRPLVAAQR